MEIFKTLSPNRQMKNIWADVLAASPGQGSDSMFVLFPLQPHHPFGQLHGVGVKETHQQRPTNIPPAEQNHSRCFALTPKS